jgi:hypothetical protein
MSIVVDLGTLMGAVFTIATFFLTVWIHRKNSERPPSDAGSVTKTDS